MKIDIHAHWYPREWVALLEKEGAAIGAQIGRNERGQVTFAVPGYKQKFQDTYIDLPTAGDRKAIFGNNAARLLRL